MGPTFFKALISSDFAGYPPSMNVSLPLPERVQEGQAHPPIRPQRRGLALKP